MVRNDVYFTGVEGLVNSEIYHDFVLAKDCPEYEIMLREDDKMEENYRDLLLGILTEGGRSEPHIKRNKKDGNSNVGAKYEKDGVILYEVESSSDEEYEPQPRRKLTSAMKQKVGVSTERENKMTRKRSRSKAKNEGENEKTEKVTRMESNDKANNKKVETMNSSTNDRAWDEYHFVRKNRKNFKNNEDHNQEKVNGDDESSADVEILDSTPCEMNKKMGPTKKRSEFRQKVIAVLRRPYDEDEYGRLWLEFEFRTPDLNHRDRSYHDYYPDLARKLEQFEDDQPKCLNLLRGLFFWLQNSMQIGSFQPWQDAECLAVMPESYGQSF